MEPFDTFFKDLETWDQYVEPEFEYPRHRSAEANGSGDRPGDDFNARAKWGPDVLEPAHWKAVGNSGEKIYWKRPGKEERGWSATTGYCKGEKSGDMLYVFSSNAAPFEADKAYSKFAAYALLNHDGDFSAASRALRAAGWGPEPATVIRSAPQAPDAGNSTDPLDRDATAADLIRVNAVVRWLWPLWIPRGVLTILASAPGVGKTRFCADLLRRIHGGLPWPDGTFPTMPPGSLALWVPADGQHSELGTMPEQMGFPPEALFLNATARNPFEGTMLDSTEDLRTFERRIVRVKPALVFIDTCLYATDRSAHKPEDAKAFFKPLQDIAARTDIGLVCVTHTNVSGAPLGKRIEGAGRVVIMLDKPDPGQEDRRKLWVKKTHSLMPAALGCTMRTEGNEYDTSPPEAPAEEGRGSRKDSHIEADCKWLKDALCGGQRRVSHTRDEAEQAGISAKRLYRAKDELGVEEFTSEGRKWWRLPSREPGEEG
jgi:hypothetical protein